MYTIKKVVILNVSIFRICDLVTDVVLLETITTYSNQRWSYLL